MYLHRINHVLRDSELHVFIDRLCMVVHTLKTKVKNLKLWIDIL